MAPSMPRVGNIGPTLFSSGQLTLVAYLEGLPQQVRIAFGYYSRLTRLLVYLHENIQEHTTLAQAAVVASMEKTAFCKFFRRTTGIKFMDFVHIVRVKRAAVLLVSSDHLSITQVADAVGYESISVFQRQFKRHLGLTAREYRAHFISGRSAA